MTMKNIIPDFDNARLFIKITLLPKSANQSVRRPMEPIPGGNTAEGLSALLGPLGRQLQYCPWFPFRSRATSTGSFNTATGAGDAPCETLQTQNTATGAGALFGQRDPENANYGQWSVRSPLAT